MLNALVRVFQLGSSLSDPSSSDKGRRHRDLTPPPPILPDGEPLSRQPSSLLMDRIRRDHPSQVAWISPSSQNASGSFTNYSAGKAGDHSPAPSPLLETTTRPKFLGSRKSSMKRMSSASLMMQSVYTSDKSETSSIASALPSKPLSPIHEQHAYVPALRQPSLDSVPKTPDSTGAFSFSSHPFLTRTLKRSSSQISTSTIASAAPSIPPLDLRPSFPTSLGLPPRGSRLQHPSLPTVLASPRHNVSVIHEGSSNLSYMTAASANAGESEMDVTEDHDEPPRVSQFRETYISSTISGSHSSLTEHEDGDLDLHDEEAQHLELDLGLPPPSSTLVDRFSRDAHCFNSAAHGDIASQHTLETSSTSTAVMESRIERRWLKGLSFGSVSFPKPSGKQGLQVTAAFILFWVGFIAPWCWLIGGWYLSQSGEMKPNGQYLSTVSLMWPRGDFKDDLDLENKADTLRSTKVGWRGKVTEFWHGSFGKERSKEGLPLSTRDITPPPPAYTEHVDILDPWVRRCRVAAIVSGVILVVACLVTLIVVASVRR